MGPGPLQEHPADFLGYITKALVFMASLKHPRSQVLFSCPNHPCHLCLWEGPITAYVELEAEVSVVTSSQITK